jgi:hypothetical protein
VGEIRNILHALEMRDHLDETENRPRMDMYENDTEVVMEFDLPGFNADENLLHLKGVTWNWRLTSPGKQEPGRFICMETSFSGCPLCSPDTVQYKSL